jgi:hypothetical protein
MVQLCRVCSSGVSDGIAIEEVDGGNDANPEPHQNVLGGPIMSDFRYGQTRRFDDAPVASGLPL